MRGKKPKTGKFIECLTCKKQIWKVPYRINKKYCSYKCMGACPIFRESIRIKHIGHPVSEEARKKISIARTGYKVSEEIKKRYSKMFRGAGNPNYKDGRSSLNYPKEFNKKRRNIIIRDNFTCQLCGDKFEDKKRGMYDKNFITVHHIDYDKYNNEEKYMIALCAYCNSSVNSQREDWIKLFQNKLNA